MKKLLAIFDLDGTLFNTNGVNYYAYKAALEEFDISLDKQYFENNCSGLHYKKFLPQLCNNDLDLTEKVHDRKIKLYSQYLFKSKMNVHLFNFIKLIKNEYNTAVASTASRANIKMILDSFGVYDLFDLIIGQEDVMYHKPHPQAFLEAMKYFNAEPCDTIIYEDSQVGLEAALQTGATVMQVRNF